jgi:hypothetical protein
MAWELSIQPPGYEDASAEGKPESVFPGDMQTCISSFFPDTCWKTKSEGTSDFGDGLIEFQIRGIPAESIWLRIHNADPALQLIALARSIAWQVINHSTGEDLESEESFTEAQIARIQKKASSYRVAPPTTTPKTSKALKVKLPKVKSKIPLLDVKPEWVLDFLDMVQLQDNEVTLDLFDDYHAALLEDERILKLKGHPTCRNDEVLLPDGQRFAAMSLSRSSATVNRFYDKFWEDAQRTRAKLVKGLVVLPNGSQYPGKDCLWVERAQGRGRRKAD